MTYDELPSGVFFRVANLPNRVFQKTGFGCAVDDKWKITIMLPEVECVVEDRPFYDSTIHGGGRTVFNPAD